MTDLYLYQTVHVARGRALHVAEHAAVLDAASREWFGRPYTPAAATLAARIEALAAAERYPTGVSGFVRIELTEEGLERLLPAGVSLYDGYAYRSLQPTAATIPYEVPFSEFPTSVREAAAVWARRAAERTGAEVAIRCDLEGYFHAAEDAPLFAVTGRTVLAAPAGPGPESVERSITRRAVQAVGLTFREEPFGTTDLRRIEELFFTDHRGITSLSRCDGQPLMTFLAERIAGALE